MNTEKEELKVEIDKIELAKQILYVRGNPYALTDDFKRITNRVIDDIKRNTIHLRKGYFGNKKYSVYYQSSDHSYSECPNYGYIVDEVGLKGIFRKRDLTDEEKESCIYYMTNYNKLNK